MTFTHSFELGLKHNSQHCKEDCSFVGVEVEEKEVEVRY
jgi:hypothetical protein